MTKNLVKLKFKGELLIYSKFYFYCWHSLKSLNNSHLNYKLKYSTISKNDIDKLELNKSPNSLDEILVGMILGDAWLEKKLSTLDSDLN